MRERYILTNFGPTYPLGIGGGALSNVDALKLLAKLGHEVLNIGFFEDDDLSEYEKRLSEAKDLKLVRGSIKNYTYLDKIISMNRGSRGEFLNELSLLSREKDNFLIFRPYGFHANDNIGHWNGRILFWDNDFDTSRAENCINITKKQKGRIAAISEMLADQMKERYGIKCDVLRSIIDWENIKLPPKKLSDVSQKPLIGLPNPNKFKFGELPFRVIEGLKEYRFLAAVTWGWDSKLLSRLEQEPNVKVLRDLIDISVFYKDIDILLVPTILPESYPRFIQEALFLRIPIVVSAIGNLPWLIRDCGIAVNSDNIADWESAIKAVGRIPFAAREAGRERIIKFQSSAESEMKGYFLNLSR